MNTIIFTILLISAFIGAIIITTNVANTSDDKMTEVLKQLNQLYEEAINQRLEVDDLNEKADKLKNDTLQMKLQLKNIDKQLRGEE